MKLVRKQIAQLMTALNRINCCYAVCAQSAALKENELMILYALADGVPYSQKQICDEWDIPRTTMYFVHERYRQPLRACWRRC